jgi:hypothetical protein
MNKIGLGNAGIKGDVFSETPQDSQHCVHSRKPHAKVSDSQHGQEIEHGLLKAWLNLDHMEHHAVSQKNHGIDEEERYGDPEIVNF